MREFSLYHKTAAQTPAFLPKSGDLVSAKFSDGAWYRAKVRRVSSVKKEAEVTFIDYGNQSTVGFNDIRPLDPRFRSLPGQAHDARLRHDHSHTARIYADSSSTASSSLLVQRATIIPKLSTDSVSYVKVESSLQTQTTRRARCATFVLWIQRSTVMRQHQSMKTCSAKASRQLTERGADICIYTLTSSSKCRKQLCRRKRIGWGSSSSATRRMMIEC